jgi:hypothetical protein
MVEQLERRTRLRTSDSGRVPTKRKKLVDLVRGARTTAHAEVHMNIMNAIHMNNDKGIWCGFRDGTRGSEMPQLDVKTECIK